MPSKNKKSAARKTPDQQPSLLDHLEIEEDTDREGLDQHEAENGGSNREDASSEDADREDAVRNVPDDQPEQPTGQPPEQLEEAYARYVEIVNETYNSRFSDARRQAAFKEAAKAHEVRITDLKRYSTAVALGIPYHNSGGADPEHSAASDQETDASVTEASETG